MSACTCRETIDEKLAAYNTKVEPVFTFGGNRVGMPWPICTIQIEKGRGKAKAMGLFASYCPLCGVSLKDDDSAQGGSP